MKMEMYPYHPVHVLQGIQKARLNKSYLPMAVVVICLILAPKVPFHLFNAISVLALGYYLYIAATHRTSKTMPPEGVGYVLSPVCGQVASVETVGGIHIVRIVRTRFTPADLRSATADDLRAPQGADQAPTFSSIALNSEWTIPAPNAKIFENRPNLPGMLIGIVPVAGECICRIPDTMTLTVTPGAQVAAGETILAETPVVQAEPETETE